MSLGSGSRAVQQPNAPTTGIRRSRRPLVTSVLAALAIASAGCGSDGTADDTSPGQPADDTSAGRPADLATDGVVGIRAAGCGTTDRFGSGVAVLEGGVVATVAHTVAGADTVTIIDVDGRDHAATVVAFDPTSDLAALRSETLDATPLPIGQSATGTASILAWSSDDGARRADATVTRRLGITIEDIWGEGRHRRTGIELRADVEVGDSGGPVVDADGAVIGIVYANSRSRPRTGFATDDAELRSLLAAVGDGPVDTGGCT